MLSGTLFQRALHHMPFLSACEKTPRDDWNALTSDFNSHLQPRGSERTERDQIHCFWSGAPLRNMSYLSLQSMVRQGHSVTLYTYDDFATIRAAIPSGVTVADAETIVPRSIYEHTVTHREIRWFSDTFRYAVLYERGGWWLDTDICLLKPLNFDSDHLFSSQWSGGEYGHFCVGDSMRAPRGSRHMAELYRHSLARLFNEERGEFGAVGPALLSEYIFADGNESLVKNILPPVVFNAIDWREASLFTSSLPEDFNLLSDARVVGVHFWNKMWGDLKLDYDSAPDGSIVGYLKNLILEPNWLTDLASKYFSDKGSVYNGQIAHHYTRVYHELFRNRSLEPLRLLEIGLCRGRNEGWTQDKVPSLEMWLRYFPNATIIGADIEDFSWFEHDRVVIHRVDQGDRAQLARLGAMERPFDIVIDDGSHASVHQHLTLGVLFPSLNEQGIFIIEDLDWQPPEIPADGVALMKDVLYNFGRNGSVVSTVMTAEEAQLIAAETSDVTLHDSFRELVLSGKFGGMGVLKRR